MITGSLVISSGRCRDEIRAGRFEEHLLVHLADNCVELGRLQAVTWICSTDCSQPQFCRETIPSVGQLPQSPLRVNVAQDILPIIVGFWWIPQNKKPVDFVLLLVLPVDFFHTKGALASGEIGDR